MFYIFHGEKVRFFFYLYSNNIFLDFSLTPLHRAESETRYAQRKVFETWRGRGWIYDERLSPRHRWFMIAFLSLERFSRVGGGQEKEGGGKKNFIRKFHSVSREEVCVTWNVRSLLSRSHCTPLMGRVWYGDNMTHLKVMVDPDATLCSRGPIIAATGAVLS